MQQLRFPRLRHLARPVTNPEFQHTQFEFCSSFLLNTSVAWLLLHTGLLLCSILTVVQSV